MRATSVAALLLAVGAVVPVRAAAAATPSAAPTITVAPSTGLSDGQSVSVAVTGFPPSTLIAVLECPATATSENQCDINSARLQTTDTGGSVTLTYSVNRVIWSDPVGVVDCALTACVVAAGTINESVTATGGLQFTNTSLPPPPFSVVLEAPHFIQSFDAGTEGAATIGARLRCNVSEPVRLRFDIQQGQTTAASDFVYPCEPGVDVHIYSDSLSLFQPGAAAVLVEASAPGDVSGQVGTVTLQSWTATLDAVNAALAGPDGAQAHADLIAAILWRITYNPVFRQMFFAALLHG